jgi:uncharacterized protein (TIGR03790 family)
MTTALLLVIASCAPSARIEAERSDLRPKGDESRQAATVEPRMRTLVVASSNEAESMSLAQAYTAARRIPDSRILSVSVPSADEISTADFEAAIRGPVLARLDAHPEIDFIVICKGVPLRLDSKWGDSVDSRLAQARTPRPQMDPQRPETMRAAQQPFFAAKKRFSRMEFGIALVCRLDGSTFEDARALIRRSIEARPGGRILLDEAEDRRAPGYAEIQAGLSRARDAIQKLGGEAWLDTERDFQTGTDLGGYVSWGSNDGAFSRTRYRDLRFRPGAIGETFVSTSARTFTPDAPGQSQICDLIKGGITGIKGYVAEPYTFALARPEILFDRYLKGWTLAESFYAASPLIGWKDVVIGDPLAAPYSGESRR